MQEHCIIPPSRHCVHMRFLLHSSCLSWHIPRRQAGESMKKHDHPHLGSTTLKYRLEKGILSELLPYRQWVVWRYQLVNNQWKKSRSILSTAEQQKPMPEERGVPFHRLSTGWKQESITASVLSFQTKTLLPALTWTGQLMTMILPGLIVYIAGQGCLLRNGIGHSENIPTAR